MSTYRRHLFLALISLSASLAVHASTASTVVSLVGYFLAIAFAAAWFLTRRNSTAQIDRNADLTERLRSSEKVIAQLQVLGSEKEQQIERARIVTEEAERRRQETADMLASLRIQVERVARVDGLTGVANRQQFDQSLMDEIKRCVRERKNVSLMLVEIDGYFEFQDINGQQKSEFVLQRVARAISDSFRRAGDMVARVGEAKFAVLLPGTEQKTSEKFAEKLRRAIYAEALPYPTSEIADRITVSIGLVSLPPNRLHKSENTIAMAENALRDAQQNGCNRVATSQFAA